MSTTTHPVLTYSQASECARIKQAIMTAARTLDVRIEGYAEILEARAIKRALDNLNAKIEEAEAFHRSLGVSVTYPRIEVDIPSILKRIDDVYDAVYYGLDELPREA